MPNDDIVISKESVDFLQQVLTAHAKQAEHTDNMLQQIHDRDYAELLATKFMIRMASKTADEHWGGTVREYEAIIDCFARALYPPGSLVDQVYKHIVENGRMDAYRKYAGGY